MSVIYKEPKSRTDIENEADEIAKIKLRIRKLTLDRDKATLKVNEQYNPEILSLTKEVENRENALAPFVSSRKRELMGKNRSASSPLSMYGFRAGNIVLKNITGKPDAVVAYELLQTPRKDCVKVSYSLDKSAIKKLLKNGDETLRKIFEMEICERFYVEPKTDKDLGE